MLVGYQFISTISNLNIPRGKLKFHKEGRDKRKDEVRNKISLNMLCSYYLTCEYVQGFYHL